MIIHQVLNVYSVCTMYVAYNLTYIYLRLVPRLSWGRRKESLVMTVYACANPYEQNMVSCFSLEKDIVISWRWHLEDFNMVTQA